jgi:hypothetical protein
VAVPVKVAGHVLLRPEQRCFLNKYGTEWIVMGALGAPTLGYGYRSTYGVASNTASASYVDVANMTGLTVPFTKYHDNTLIEISYTAGGYVTATAHEARWAIRFSQDEGETPYTPSDLVGPSIYWNNANQHLSAHVTYPVAQVMPAGKYTGTLRWRRVEGATSSISTDDQDLYYVVVREIIDPAATVL